MKINKPLVIALFSKDGEVDLPGYARQEVEFELKDYDEDLDSETWANKDEITFPACTAGEAVVEGGWILDSGGNVLWSFVLDPSINIKPGVMAIEFLAGGLRITED